MKLYGKEHDKRMTGLHETADYHTFSSAVTTVGQVSEFHDLLRQKVRIFEDRRPSSNMYVVL